MLLGWDIHEVDGMTSFHDTNYAGQGAATAAMLDKYDLVFSHIEAPDEASHQADWKTKIAAIEHIDQHIVGPVLEKLRTFPDGGSWSCPIIRPTSPRGNTATRPTPFAMGGSGIEGVSKQTYSEKHATSGGMSISGVGFASGAAAHRPGGRLSGFRQI